MNPLTKQDEQFLRMLRVSWESQPAAAASAMVSRAEYEEAMRYAIFYAEESCQKAEQVERLQQQRTWCFLGMVAGLVGMAAAASILLTIKIAG